MGINEVTGMFIGVSLFSILFSFLSVLFSSYVLAELRGVQKSTHQIQYVDPSEGLDDNMFLDEDGFQELDDETRKKLDTDQDLFGDETTNDKIKY